MPDGREQAGRFLRAGDLVLVYEARSGRTLIRREINGSEVRVPCLRGQEGIIAVCRATAGVSELADSEPETYIDGSRIWWRWHAPLDLISTTGFVPRVTMNRVLGYADTYNLRGFGDFHSGLKEIQEHEFEQLLKAFRGQDQGLPKYTPPQGTGVGRSSGGESVQHEALKRHVAAHPSSVLNEQGLRTAHVEYQFPTGDRADIVLWDKFGRIVGVEVEVEVSEGQLAGLLQAIKYRHMLEVISNRNTGDSRAVLVANRIAGVMKDLANRYGVECHEIARDELPPIGDAEAKEPNKAMDSDEE